MCVEDQKKESGRAVIGMLCWEAGCVPRGLMQMETLAGNSTNPDTFSFPVMYSRVKGANIHTILENPSEDVLNTMIEEARKMESEGIRAITTSCGFNAIFQRELASSVNIPVFTSSLMQIPMIHKMVKKGRMIGVITAKGSALTREHLQSVGIPWDIPVHIEGLEKCSEWNRIFTAPDEDIDIKKVESDVVSIAGSMAEKLDLGAIVLECTDLPPFADAIRKRYSMPVFDIVTLTNYIYSSLISPA